MAGGLGLSEVIIKSDPQKIFVDRLNDSYCCPGKQLPCLLSHSFFPLRAVQLTTSRPGNHPSHLIPGYYSCSLLTVKSSLEIKLTTSQRFTNVLASINFLASPLMGAGGDGTRSLFPLFPKYTSGGKSFRIFPWEDLPCCSHVVIGGYDSFFEPAFAEQCSYLKVKIRVCGRVACGWGA